jgi:hypothetical protein
MINPPNFFPGGNASLTTNRYDFENHYNGVSFKHTATQIIVSPPIAGYTNVDQVLRNFISGTSVVMGGNVTGASGSCVVVALQGNAVAPQTLSSVDDGYALIWHNSSSQWVALPIPVSAGFTAGGDLSGTSSSQTVISISGSSPFAISPASLQWLKTTSSPTLTQAIQTTDTATNSISIIAQSADTSASTNTSGGNVVLQGGNSKTTGTGHGGFVNINSGETVKNITISASTYTVDTNSQLSDLVIFTDSTSNAINITLPTPTNGRFLIIKDKTGQAGTHNITLTASSGNIDGSGTYVLSTNFASVILIADGSNFFVN